MNLRTSGSDVLVVMPTYNEIDNLGDMVRRVLESCLRADILVVDDASPDGTGRLANALARVSDRVHVLNRTAKSGLGDAYRAGFAWGLEQGYDFLVEMDADGSHQPEQLHDLLAATRSTTAQPAADVVLGSRWVAGGGAPGWAVRRALLSRAGSLYARILLGIPARDITGGYRVFSAAALRAIDFATVEAQGYCFQIEMLWRASEAGLRVREVPITFVERTHGVSKMSSSIVTEAIARVTVWGVLGLPVRIRRRLRRPAAVSLIPDVQLSDGASVDPSPVYDRTPAAHRLDGGH